MAPKDFRPPEPVGEPFRGDPKDSVPFLTEGQPLIPLGADEATTPWMNDSAFPTVAQGPPSHSVPTGPPSLRGSSLEQPQFRPPAKPPLDPEAAQTQRMAKIGLASGIASIFFFWPLFGPIAIGLGINAIARGERKIGSWAVATGAAGILIGLIVTILVLTNVVDPDQLLRELQNKK
jgi:hypothetical protein